MNKHTKGPWSVFKGQVDEKSNNNYYLTSPSGVVGYWRGGKDYHDDNFWALTEADAKLIAAAPEMYEALCSTLDILSEIKGMDGHCNDIRKVINKIEFREGQNEGD